MIRTIFWFTYFWLYQFYALSLLLKVNYLTKKGYLDKADQLINNIVQNWASNLIKLTGSSITVTGKENIPLGNVLFISNHQGNFDIPLLISCIDRPKGFVAKIELKKLPLVHLWMKKIHCIFIDRKDFRQSVSTILEGIKLLKSGKSLVLFPEGTRSKSPVLSTFKAGGMKLALKSGVPIVPITICGSYKILEANGYRIKPAKVKIIIDQPIYVEKLNKEEQSHLAEMIQTIIQNNLSSLNPENQILN